MIERHVRSVTMFSRPIGARQRIHTPRSVEGAGARSPLAVGAFYRLREQQRQTVGSGREKPRDDREEIWRAMETIVYGGNYVRSSRRRERND